MQLVTDITHFQSPEHTVLTSGTFDGIHIGHQRIITQVVERAKEQGLLPTVLTFFPHPRMVLDPSAPIALIQTIEERAQLLASYGIAQLVIQPFSKEFAALSAQDYVRELLVGKLRAKEIIIGYDHRFGKNRSAGIEELKAFGQQYHFQVEEIPVQEVDSFSVSPTKTRQALEKGDVQTANHYLGRCRRDAGFNLSAVRLCLRAGYFGRTIDYHGSGGCSGQRTEE